METYCDTCIDQNTENCKLISKRERAAQSMKIIILALTDGIGSVGYASGPLVIPESDTSSTRLHDKINVQREAIQLCVKAHIETGG